MSDHLALPAARIRELRGTKQPVSSDRYVHLQWEEERAVDGTTRPTLTVFLAGAECPFSCVFCDLWQYTIDGPTPAGAIAHQVESAIADAGLVPDGATVKLYNASNFFEARAVPVDDLPRVATALASFARVVVECHPKLVGDSCFAFADRLAGKLEVAMGLETAHPAALPLLNKGMTMDDFDAAASQLAQRGIALRSFVLVGAPFIEETQSREWVRRSVTHALSSGARHVSLIPVRPGNGALEQLQHDRAFTPPTLADLEASLVDCLPQTEAVVTADLWDAWRFGDCSQCSSDRVARLTEMNRTGLPVRGEPCPKCGV